VRCGVDAQDMECCLRRQQRRDALVIASWADLDHVGAGETNACKPTKR
jgi:hypothetical protein